MRDFIPPSDLPNDIGPFSEANFKLTVLSAAMEEGALDLGDYPEFLQAIEGPNYDYEERGYDPSTKALDYLTRYPLDPETLNELDTLVFDGGNEIYPYIWPFWGGESELFDIQTLTDLRLLPNLRTFEVISMLLGTDLSPLAACPKLRDLSLGLTGTWQDFPTLASLADLQSLTVFGSDLPPDAASTLDTLRTRGVKIRIF